MSIYIDIIIQFVIMLLRKNILHTKAPYEINLTLNSIVGYYGICRKGS